MKPTTLFTSILFTLTSAAKRPCTQAEIALATGIHLNIQGQYAEYNGTISVIDVETRQPGDLLAFSRAKGFLQSDIQAGMNLRLFNQQIAPEGNPAIPGLKQYEAAQETEKGEADCLTGTYSEDKDALDKLKSNIMAGIKLNEMNLANVSHFVDDIRGMFVTLMVKDRLLLFATFTWYSHLQMRWVLKGLLCPEQQSRSVFEHREEESDLCHDLLQLSSRGLGRDLFYRIHKAFHRIAF